MDDYDLETRDLKHCGLMGVGLIVTFLVIIFSGSALDSLLLVGTAPGSGLERIGDGVVHTIACVDREPDCGAWAAAGQCEANSEYMSVACPLACKSQGCGQAPPLAPVAALDAAAGPCLDSDLEQCPRWKEAGDCEKNAEWMSDFTSAGLPLRVISFALFDKLIVISDANCRLSCKVCMGVPGAPATVAAA